MDFKVWPVEIAELERFASKLALLFNFICKCRLMIEGERAISNHALFC